MRVDFPYLMSDRDRHGSRRYYVRRQGRKIRIREIPGTEAFVIAYADALRAINPLLCRNAEDGSGRQPWLVGSQLFFL